MPGTLPRAVNNPAVVTPVSTTRLVQTNTTIETAAGYLFPAGVVSGGVVSKTTGFSVQVGISVFLAEMVSLVLAAPQSYTATQPSTNVRLWGHILRTAAAQTSADDRTLPDTYTLQLTHTFGASYATEPASGPWFPLADWNTDGTGVSGNIDNGPAGKYLKLASPLWQGKNAIALAEVAAVAAGEQFSVFPSLSVRGLLIVRGALRVRGWGE